MNKALRYEVEAILREVVSGPVHSLALRAAKVLPRMVKKAKPSFRKAEKKAKRLAKSAETAALREGVFKRAGDACELESRCWAEPTEMHHLEGGTGRRLQQQRMENCMAVCGFHHRQYHRDPARFRGEIEKWCAKYGYPIPSRFRRAA